MRKNSTSFRLSDLTIKQLAELARIWNMTKTETLSVLVNWAYQQELRQTTSEQASDVQFSAQEATE